MRLFLDTSFVIALRMARDQNASKAREQWERCRVQRDQFLTTSLVLAEVAAFLNTRGHHADLAETGRLLTYSPTVRFIWADEVLLRAGWNLLLSRPDKRWSLADCVCFALMNREGVSEALTFDEHFAQAGFTVRA
jgi:predicted nucleic acid-binding protein